MGFMRRKSMAAAGTEDNRPRNRLSKPMTSKSPSSQRIVSGKQSPRTSPKNVSVASQLTLNEIARSMSLKEPGVQIQSQPVTIEFEDIPPPTPPKDAPKKTGVASLVKQFENAASNSQSSFSSSSASQKPLSSISGSKRLTDFQIHRAHNVQSREQLASHKHSVSTLTISPSDSLERLVDPFAIPRRRESKYRPGEATRKPSWDDKENQPPLPTTPPQLVIDKPLPPIQDQAQDKFQEEKWTPPPPIGRAGTPASLEPKAIGNLRLGSLHIVNGRSSPVLSELSRHLISRQLRDVSSEYADSTYSKDLDSDAWEDVDAVEDLDDTVDEIKAPATPTRALVEAETHQACDLPKEPQTPIHRKPLPLDSVVRSPDRTSIMAQSYISELQGSPFSYGTASPVSPISPVSTGSVVHRQKEEDISTAEAEVDFDGTNERRISLDSEQPSIGSEQQTVVSMPSVAETTNTRDQVFSSALEFQAPHFQPPPSPERGISPQSSRRDSIGRPSEHVDSGYHSSNSALSLNVNESKLDSRPAPLRVQTAPVFIEMTSPSTQSKSFTPTSPKKEQSPRKLGRFFPIRPAARKSPAVEVPMEISRTFPSGPPAVTAVTKVDESSKKTKVDKEVVPPKPQNKLHKLRPHSRNRESKEIVVQRLASCESTLDIPAIPDSAKANLHFRSQQVPELEKTYISQHHIKNQASNSSLALPTTDIRFPSPMPSLVEEEEERSSRNGGRDRSRGRNRPRSKSRRRSFLDMFRSEKDLAKRDTEARKEEAEASLADFGDVLRSLGTNPYDIAYPRPQSRDHSTIGNVRNVNPHNISSNSPRKRLSMNDEEASEYARVRSHSFNHGDKHKRIPPFNDRGDFYDRLRRMSMTEEEVPPVPPMPDQDQLKRISQRYSLQSQFVTTPTREQQQWDMSPSSRGHLESSPAPLPPAHSPRPVFVNHGYEADYPVEDDMQLAPPPPSHSPAPMDISAHRPSSRSPQPRNLGRQQESGSPWDAQARAWRARRKSASEVLQQHRRSLEFNGGDHMYGDEAVIEDDEGSIYPIIPPRNPERQQRQYQQPANWMAGGAGYDDLPPQHYPQRSQTWDDSAHDPYRFDQERACHSQLSYQSRQHRHHTWGEPHDDGCDNSQSQFDQQGGYVTHQSKQRPQRSNDSRQSFYSHHNCPIDRPFDGPPAVGYDSDDEYGCYDRYYPPQVSPVRGHGMQRQEYDYSQPNGYEKQYQQQYYNGYDPQGQYDDGYNQHLPNHSRSHSQQQYYQPSPIHSNRDSFLPRSPGVSRPSSRHSQRSNVSAVSLAEELHPDIDHRPSPAPDYGRYSGGMGFGYEGRNKGFGGSAGTRSVSGKADATFKGTELRGSHGVDLGDVPVIGVMKKI